MVRQTRFQIAKKDIISAFEKHPTTIFTYNSISQILNENRGYWRLPKSLTAQKFIDSLIEATPLEYYNLEFPHKNFRRFSWGKPSLFLSALSLMENAYFTHYTALFLHGLTDQVPKTVYVNFEQIKKRFPDKKLYQKNIDFAFSKPQRTSNNIAFFNDYKICLLNGKFTNKSGVSEIETSNNEKLLVTDVERTLIDIVVRPVYAGGVFEVLNAYKKAYDKVSINKLKAMLKKINYIYPYHQAIGFYLDKSGMYKESQIELLREGCDFDVDFYLTHQIKEKAYSKKWRMYFPKEF